MHTLVTDSITNGLGTALWHAAVYAIASGVLLIAGFYVLDWITPGHLGKHLSGGSMSAALVTSAWVIGNGLILFTACWVNGEGGVRGALLWTLVFGVFGVAVNALMIVIIDAVTPGNLRHILVEPGAANALSKVMSAFIFAISIIICVSII